MEQRKENKGNRAVEALDALYDAVDRGREALDEVRKATDRVAAILDPAELRSSLEVVVSALRDRNHEKPFTESQLDVVMEAANTGVPGEEDLPSTPEAMVDLLATLVATTEDGPKRRYYMDRLNDRATRYLRDRMQELLVYKAFKPRKCTDDMLSYSDNGSLRIMWELEPGSPGSMRVNVAPVEKGELSRATRYDVPIARVIMPAYRVDVACLAHRKVLFHEGLDRLLESFRETMDGAFLNTIDGICMNADGRARIYSSELGSNDEPVPPWKIENPNRWTGKAQWTRVRNGEAGFSEATKMLPLCNEDGRFANWNYMALMSEETAKRLSFDPNRFRVRIETFPDKYKKRLGVVYFLAESVYLGQGFFVDDATVFARTDAFFLEAFGYWMGGFAIGDVGAVARAEIEGIFEDPPAVEEAPLPLVDEDSNA